MYHIKKIKKKLNFPFLSHSVATSPAIWLNLHGHMQVIAGDATVSIDVDQHRLLVDQVDYALDVPSVDRERNNAHQRSRTEIANFC